MKAEIETCSEYRVKLYNCGKGAMLVIAGSAGDTLASVGLMPEQLKALATAADLAIAELADASKGVR